MTITINKTNIPLFNQSSQSGSQPFMDEQPRYESRRNSSSGRTDDSIIPNSTSNLGRRNANYSSIRRRSPSKYRVSDPEFKSMVPPNTLQSTPQLSRRIPRFVTRHTSPAMLSEAHPRSNQLLTCEDPVTVVKKAPAMSLHQNYFHQ